MLHNIVITIDGPAGSGKSSIARLFEERLSFHSINSGAFYRCATFLFCNLLSTTDLEAIYQNQNIHEYHSQIQTIIRNYIPVMQWKEHSMHFSHPIEIKGKTYASIHNNKLFSPNIDTYVSILSTYEELRKSINTQIRHYLKKGRWIIEGRDAGTHIFPEAILKFYLDADINTRINRRIAQYSSKEESTKKQDNNSISQELIKRDTIDRNKGKYSLQSNNNELFYIDSTKKTLEQIYKIIYTNIIVLKL